jgi:uncharacterized protein (DUF433 family)
VRQAANRCLALGHSTEQFLGDSLGDSRSVWCYMGAMKNIDWTECALIETVPGKLSGVPVLRGTRVRPQDLLVNRDEGVEWLARNHGIKPETIQRLFAFYDAHKSARVPHPA